MSEFKVDTISLESKDAYPVYYRRHGVRRAVQLAAPPLNAVETLDLPRDSILHFISPDESLYGMPTDDYILRNINSVMMVEHIAELGDVKGPPRPTRLPVTAMVTDYHRKFRRTRAVRNLDIALRNPQTLVIENYGLLPHLYRYTTSFFRGYYKWWNIQAALWKRVGVLADLTEREQFLQCRLPKNLPTIAQLKRGEASVSRAVLNTFVEDESLFILELWKWLGPKREESVFNFATPAQLAKMNLVWVESGRWLVMNLGLLNSWRKDETGKGLLSPEMLQRRFLYVLMFLFESRTVTEDKKGAGLVKSIVVEDTATPGAAPATVPAEKVVSKTVVLSVPATGETASQRLKILPGLNVDNLPEFHAIEETDENILAIDAAISKDLDALTELHDERARPDDGTEEDPQPQTRETPVVNYQPKERSLPKSIMSKVDALADGGLLSGAEYRRFQTISTAYQKLPDPYGTGKTLAEEMEIDVSKLAISETPQIPDKPTVFDKSMLRSSLLEFDSRYIQEFLKKDVLRAVVGLQHAGIAITGYQVEKIRDAMNAYESHTVELSPVQGKASTLHFRIPTVDPDGTFKANGVRYLLRKQRNDLPIRKLTSSKVALTSYYSKLFVNRSEKVVNNYPLWLTEQIAAKGMNPDDLEITNLMMSNVFNSNHHTPRIYSTMAMRFRSFSIGEYDFFFDYAARSAQFGEDAVKKAEEGGLVVMGRRGDQLILADENDAMYVLNGIEAEPIGTIESLLHLKSKVPLEMVELKLFTKNIPIGLVLAYHLGLSQLLKVLGVNPRRVPAGERFNLSEDEYLIRFEDESLVLNRDNRLASLILAGLTVFEGSTRNYPVHLFDKKDIYFNVLDQADIGVRYLRELDLMLDLFVDPITEEILQKMGEPTDLIGLLIRSCELLLTDWAPDETAMSQMRVKGYERIAGTIYGELTRAIRIQRARGAIANAKIELPPYAVWQAIQKDSAVKLVEESNPVHCLKEREEITYSGNGGRSARSMVKRTRVFHPEDMGIISEATKDSADVAITTFLTADPQLTDLRGMTKRYDPATTGVSSLISTSALLAPAADRDDPKRVNFISIQQSAGTFAKGYRPSPLKTGYEQIMAHRTDDLFAYTAKGKGKVTQLTNKSVTVTYEDGTVKSTAIGRRFGSAAGMTFPHAVESAVNVGDEVSDGDIIAYNTHYFEIDPLQPKQVVWKAGVLVKTAILESVVTLEDSSAISEKTARLLETQLTKVRDLTVSFKDTIHNLVSVGSEVDVESILCTIEDPLTAQSNLFDNDSINTLRLLAANTPRAKFKGVVEKVEVFYNGDIDDLSPSLQELAQESDRNRKREARELRTEYTSGRVDDTLRIDGDPLVFETAVVRVYITGPVSAGVGDKGVFANQMKTIFGQIMSGVNTTESGEEIGAMFGYSSINDRIVFSPEIIGTTNTLLMVISKRVADVYRGKVKHE